MDAENVSRTWTIMDHMCRKCGGRVLRCATGNGMTPGGDPLFRCADCGEMNCGTPSSICWCGFAHRNQRIRGRGAYMCVPFSEINIYTQERGQQLKAMFDACGCDTDKGEVGVVLTEDYQKFRKNY